VRICREIEKKDDQQYNKKPSTTTSREVVVAETVQSTNCKEREKTEDQNPDPEQTVREPLESTTTHRDPSQTATAEEGNANER
jgi:hypothetical protein